MKTTILKTISFAIFTIVASNGYAQNEDNDVVTDQVVGIFEGFNEELNLYSFSVNYIEDGLEMTDEYQFIFKDEKLLKKFDLKSEEHIGKIFVIKFKVEVVTKYNQEEDYEDYIEEYTVIEIDLVK
jgi:hypothetical protein